MRAADDLADAAAPSYPVAAARAATTRANLPVAGIGWLAIGCGTLIATPTLAQRADANAVTAAEDAFGTSVGYQSVGLYTPTDARGFSPKQAGNLRIEGLYFDYVMPDADFDPCLVRKSTMRIGIAAQSFSFPAPTGIVDLTLSTPGDASEFSLTLARGPFGIAGGLVEGQGAVSEQLRVSACAGYYEGFLLDGAERSESLVGSLGLRWRPAPGTEVSAFGEYAPGGAHGVVPAVYLDGSVPPPLFDSRHLATRGFTSAGWRQHNVGVLLKQDLGHELKFSGGVFQSEERDPQSFSEALLAVQPARTAQRELDVTPPLTAISNSGELRLARSFGAEKDRQELKLSVRGRHSDRAYGGDAFVEYGTVNIDAGPPAEGALYSTGPTSSDEVRQLDVGAVFEERRAELGSFGIGLLKSHYQRTIRAPDSPAHTESVSPWLGNVRFTLLPSRRATVYGSYVQGLEDSALAPITSLHPRQASPATRSYQADAGVRYAASERLSLIVGGFEIGKGYFNLGEHNVYTELGRLTTRGAETSLNYASGGLTVVAGGVWLQPRVERTLPEPGATGRVPIGPAPLSLKFSLDCAPESWRPWAASLNWSSWSQRVATADDREYVPGYATLGAGLRYETKLRGHSATVRLDGENLTNARGISLSPLWQVWPELGRRFALQIAFDL